jgi:hypothetical protein
MAVRKHKRTGRTSVRFEDVKLRLESLRSLQEVIRETLHAGYLKSKISNEGVNCFLLERRVVEKASLLKRSQMNSDSCTTPSI